MAFDPECVDREWLDAWMTGRALARGLPLPVSDSGGWRAEIGSADELRRWVFAGLTTELQRLACEITNPALKLRAVASAEDLRAFLPRGWRIEAQSYAMVGPACCVALSPLQEGFRLEVQSGGRGVHAFLLDSRNELAASGHGGAGDEAFVYDRIVTVADHRRKGLGRALMATLASLRPDPALPQLLVATEAGRKLYEALGWHVVAPYASASWVGDSPVQN